MFCAYRSSQGDAVVPTLASVLRATFVLVLAELGSGQRPLSAADEWKEADMQTRRTTRSTMVQLAVPFWQTRSSRTGSGARSTALRAVRLGLTTVVAIAGLMFAFSSAAGAAVARVR